MVRFTSSALAACAAAFHVAAGLRSEHHPVLWHEHPVSSAETLHENLAAMLAKANVSQATTAERDANAQERMLRGQSGRGLLASIKRLWQSASANACHEQLGRLINELMKACEGSQPQPKADWLLDYYVPALPNKTCTESVSDIFTLGNELVETLRISRDAVASLALDDKMLRRYQGTHAVARRRQRSPALPRP